MMFPTMKNTFRLSVCLCILFLSSCKRDRLTLYSYKGVNLTRIDKDAETYFYYGDFRDKSEFPSEYIKATYSGSNYLMSSYVIFNNDKTITFVDMGDGIEKQGSSKYLNVFEHKSNISFIKWQEGFQGKFDSLLRIDDVLKHEQAINKENNSKVKAVYNQ